MVREGNRQAASAGNAGMMDRGVVLGPGGAGPRRSSAGIRSAFALAAVLLAALIVGQSCRRDPKAQSRKYFASALDYFGQEKYGEAALQFRNAINKDPQGTWASHYYLALIALRQERPQLAYDELKATIELQPSFFAARLELADLLLTGERAAESREQTEAVLAAQPKNARAKLLLGKALLMLKDYPGAAQQFDALKQMTPNDAGVWSASGLARIPSKQFAAAESDFQKAIQLDPHGVDGYRNMSNLLRLTGRAGEAEKVLTSAADKNPDSMDIHLALADFYYQEGRRKDVDDLFGRMKARAAAFPGLDGELGDFWMWRDEVERASKEFEVLAAQKNPDLVAQKKLISASITLGHLDEAERLNQAILAKTPGDPEALTFRGALRYLRGDASGAVGELQSAIKTDPQSIFANYYLGLAQMRLNRLEDAEAAFYQCTRFNDQFMAAFEKLGEVRFLRQDWRGAEEYGQTVIRLSPQHSEGYLLLAQAQFQSGEVSKAVATLKSAEKFSSDSGAFHELLGLCYLKQGQTDAAIRECQQAWQRGGPDRLQGLSRFADAFIAQGQIDQGVRTLRQFASQESGYYDILTRLYLRKGDLGSAETTARQAIQADSGDWFGHVYLGEVYKRRGQDDDALAEFNEAIHRRPGEIPAYIFAGDLCLQQGKLEQAAAEYEEALKHDPDSPLAGHGVARVWAEQGTHLDEAQEMVQRLRSKYPEDPHLADTQGWIYYKKGQYTMAVDVLRRSVEHQPNDSLSLFHLGLTYWKLGQAGMSRRYLASALRLGLGSPRWESTAKEVLADL